MTIDPATGRDVADCPETETHNRHMKNLRNIRTTADRREYIDGVMRSEGKFAANWLRDDFAAEWNKDKS